MIEGVSGEVRESFLEEITPESSEALIAKMVECTYQDVERVVLEVASPGGEVASAIHLYEALLSTSFELVTCNLGEVASMGNLVFLAGDKRVAAPEATFLLHPVTFDGAVRLDADDLRRSRTRAERAAESPKRIAEYDLGIARLESETREIQSILEARTRLSGRGAARLIQEAKPLSAASARAVGIVDAVAPPDMWHSQSRLLGMSSRPATSPARRP
ncbi:MAG TPA: ATP-dependent Clp protease proteolytic subunit [Solirubrobacteraceae bacterium]|nr:ATP-dependent Clp protease proteolytic subunit [Solirubrobacteraceae bacterium]